MQARLAMQEKNVDIQEGTRLRSVRRRLFQDDDDDNESVSDVHAGVNDNLANRLFEEARESRETAKERWNFDFENDQPLPGRYEWVKLDDQGNEISNSGQSNRVIKDVKDKREEKMQIDNNTANSEHNDTDGKTISDT